MKIYLQLLLGLVFFSCRNDKSDPTPALLYPVEVLKTESYNFQATVSKFSYDQSRRLIKEETLVGGQLDFYKSYEYDANSRLTTVSYFNSKNVLQEQNYLSYTPSGKLNRFSHAYIDTSGNKHPHHSRNFEYEANGKISRVQDFSPAGMLQKTLAITDETGLQILVEESGADNTVTLKSFSSFDGKSHPLHATGINFLSQLRPGNELSNKLFDASGKELVSWTKDITYNPSGYPVKIVQAYSNGVVKTESYTYSTMN